MGKSKNKIRFARDNYEFIDSSLLNESSFMDYFNRLKKIALSIFEWENLPESMDARALEQYLFYFGSAAVLKADIFKTGTKLLINTKASSHGDVNIYGLPTSINCYSYSFSETRPVYYGLNDKKDNQCVLVMNNWDRVPTAKTIELFSYRLYEAERTADVNVKNQKFPLLILIDENQRLTFENMYSQIDGNKPAIFGDRKNIDLDKFKVLKTDAPIVFDKLMEYKKEIWNEALTFLGINNIDISKKERLISGEANSNNEVINLNLQSYLAPRQKACEQINKLFGLEGENKVKVRVRSDLANIIKQNESIVNDYNKNNIPDELEGGVINE